MIKVVKYEFLTVSAARQETSHADAARASYGASENWQRFADEQLPGIEAVFAGLDPWLGVIGPRARGAGHNMSLRYGFQMVTLQDSDNPPRFIRRQGAAASYLGLQGLDVYPGFTGDRGQIENSGKVGEPINVQHYIRLEIVQDRLTGIKASFEAILVCFVHMARAEIAERFVRIVLEFHRSKNVHKFLCTSRSAGQIPKKLVSCVSGDVGLVRPPHRHPLPRGDRSEARWFRSLSETLPSPSACNP